MSTNHTNTLLLKKKLLSLAERLTDGMNDPDVAHRLRLLEPGLQQLEAVVSGIESKVDAVAAHRKSMVVVGAATGQPKKPRTGAANH